MASSSLIAHWNPEDGSFWRTKGASIAQRNLWRAGKVGVATWLGLLVGTAVKVAIVFTMVGMFVVALLV